MNHELERKLAACCEKLDNIRNESKLLSAAIQTAIATVSDVKDSLEYINEKRSDFKRHIHDAQDVPCRQPAVNRLKQAAQHSNSVGSTTAKKTMTTHPAFSTRHVTFCSKNPTYNALSDAMDVEQLSLGETISTSQTPPLTAFASPSTLDFSPVTAKTSFDRDGIATTEKTGTVLPSGQGIPPAAAAVRGSSHQAEGKKVEANNCSFNILASSNYGDDTGGVEARSELSTPSLTDTGKEFILTISQGIKHNDLIGQTSSACARKDPSLPMPLAENADVPAAIDMDSSPNRYDPETTRALLNAFLPRTQKATKAELVGLAKTSTFKEALGEKGTGKVKDDNEDQPVSGSE